MNLLSIDYGTRKCGIATATLGFVFAWWTVWTEAIIPTIEKIIAEKKMEKVILGMPYNIDGSMSEHGRRVQEFWKKLIWKIGIPIEYMDERLTTAEAIMEFSDDTLEGGDVDAASARLILERYIRREE